MDLNMESPISVLIGVRRGVNFNVYCHSNHAYFEVNFTQESDKNLSQQQIAKFKTGVRQLLTWLQLVFSLSAKYNAVSKVHL